MQEKLLAIKEAAFNEISAAENSGTLEEIRVKYLGKKGELTTILRGMGSLTPEERPIVGKLVNEAKSEVEQKLEEVGTAIKTKEINIQIIIPNFNFIQNYNSLYSNRPIYITFHWHKMSI